MATLLRREIFPNTSVFLGRQRMEALENWTQEKSANRGVGKSIVFTKNKKSGGKGTFHIEINAMAREWNLMQKLNRRQVSKH